MYVQMESVVFHVAKIANFAISTLQNECYFWSKVCKNYMLLNTNSYFPYLCSVFIKLIGYDSSVCHSFWLFGFG